MLEAIFEFLRGLLLFAGCVGQKSLPKPLSPEREKELLERLMKGDEEAKAELIEHDLRLVAHIAKKYKAPGRDRDDLLQIGSIGLIKAANTYTPERGRSFAAYAGRCIENAICS